MKIEREKRNEEKIDLNERLGSYRIISLDVDVS